MILGNGLAVHCLLHIDFAFGVDQMEKIELFARVIRLCRLSDSLVAGRVFSSDKGDNQQELESLPQSPGQPTPTSLGHVQPSRVKPEATFRSSLPSIRFNKRPNLVVYPAIRSQTLFLRLGISRQTRRVVEAHMDDLRFSREDGARLVSMVAYGHDMIEINAAKLAYMLRALPRDVYARLCHDSHGVGVQPVGLDPR